MVRMPDYLRGGASHKAWQDEQGCRTEIGKHMLNVSSPKPQQHHANLSNLGKMNAALTRHRLRRWLAHPQQNLLVLSLRETA